MTNEDLIRIVNFKQACAYVREGIQPVYLEYDNDKKRMVFVFKEQDTKEIWNLWKNHLIII